MNLILDTNLPEKYHSNSQRARIITEHWLYKNMFCPICGAEHLVQFEANRPVADFYCDTCKQEYELKSKEAKFLGHTISDGAYDTMIQRITSNNNPNLFFMTHNENAVNNLILIPRFFFTPAIIEKRKPLADTARRAGWVGCNINISNIPNECKISVINSGIISDKETVLGEYKKIQSLKEDNVDNRGWLLDILFCINQIQNDTFSLDMIYSFETYLYQKHPNNKNIRAKIRQQLQVLRDKGFLEFISRGVYHKNKAK